MYLIPFLIDGKTKYYKIFKSFIRIKRRNQTYGFLCDMTNDKLIDIKTKTVAAMNQFADDNTNNETITTDSIRLMIPTVSSNDSNNDSTNDEDTTPSIIIMEDDNELLSEYEEILKKNALFYFVLKVAENEYESVDIDSTDLEETNILTTSTTAPTAATGVGIGTAS